MPRLQSATLESLKTAPLGPGVMIANMATVNPANIAAAMGGDDTKGRMLGAMTSAPTFTAANEYQDLTENIVGINAALKGANQFQRSDVTFEVELVEMTDENLHLIHPMLEESDWMNGAGTPAKIGTKFTPKGYISDSDYVNNLVMVTENKDTSVFICVRAFNCISNDDFELQFDDDGNVSGISATFMAHSGPDNYDEDRGVYLPPYEIYKLTDPVVTP